MIFEKGMEKTLATYEQWWAGDLNRPIMPIVITGLEPTRKPPEHRYEGMNSFGNPKITPEELIDGVDYEFSCMEFIGDAYPFLNNDHCGAGAMAAFLGADVKLAAGSIWFFPKAELPIEELHLEYDKDNFWFKRTKDVMAEAKLRWGDSVVIGMPDLGGVMDILATFRGTENLLFDLYDSPEEVLRLVGDAEALWHRYYAELSEYVTPGLHTDWSGILSSKRSYMTQSDFSYMLSTEMFDKFVFDELRNTCEFLDRGCYHLDGLGQIPFLDRLMRIKGMDLIQWVPGDGTPATQDWFDLYCKILDAGKHLQIMYDTDHQTLSKLIEHYNSGRNIARMVSRYPISMRKKATEILSKFS